MDEGAPHLGWTWLAQAEAGPLLAVAADFLRRRMRPCIEGGYDMDFADFERSSDGSRVSSCSRCAREHALTAMKRHGQHWQQG